MSNGLTDSVREQKTESCESSDEWFCTILHWKDQERIKGLMSNYVPANYVSRYRGEVRRHFWPCMFICLARSQYRIQQGYSTVLFYIRES
jgi:hypothetical protein